MNIEKKDFKRVSVIAVGGRVDSNEAARLEEVLNSTLAAKQYHIIMDLQNLEYISSRGLRALISSLKETRRWNRGDVRLVNVPARIRQVLDIAGLTPLFKIYDNSVDAVGSF